MGDRLKQSRQPFGDSLDVWIEWKICAVSRFSEHLESALRRIGAPLLKQKQPGPGRVQLLGGRHRRVEIAIKTVANDDHSSQRPLLRLPQRLLENAADLDETAADASGLG